MENFFVVIRLVSEDLCILGQINKYGINKYYSKKEWKYSLQEKFPSSLTFLKSLFLVDVGEL